MRSDEIHNAIANGHNRFEICHLIAKGMRKMHRSGTRTEDSINEVLSMLGPKAVVAAVGLVK